jgi:glycosyltransferase involved in cell wall biosynthesis
MLWKADVGIFTYPILPLANKRPTLVVIYDMQFWTEESERSPANRLVLAMVKLMASKATRIITISQFSRAEIIKFLGVRPDKVVVAYPGCDYAPGGSEFSLKTLQQKWNIPSRYILSVPGTFARRKNVANLLVAYSLIPPSIREECKLVLVARKVGADWPKVRDSILTLGLRESVIITDYVSNRELVSLYQHAQFLIHPSFYEVFGLPVLEAMSVVTPVISSNRSSLPEVVGNGGILFDPSDSTELSMHMLRVIRDENLRRKLGVVGQIRAREFTWPSMVNTIADAIKTIERRTAL